MNIFFRGAITSSPIKTWKSQGPQPSYSSDESFPFDTSYECFSTNPETGLVHVCRRSPRLLANGYYVLTEDSVVTDDHGNLTLTPTKTNISYKENLARIFHRRRKARRSFATLLNDVSQSLLSGGIFGRDGTLSSAELSSCLDVVSSAEQDTSVCFTYDPTEIFPEVESRSEDCSGPAVPAQSPSSLTDAVPQSKCYCTPTHPSSDTMFRKVLLLFLFTLCVCATMFSRCVYGGIAVAVAFLFLISSICGPMSGTACISWIQRAGYRIKK